jgi:hypothetical protein
MYEIWLAMNIVYEIALDLWPALLPLLLVWLALLLINRQRLGGLGLLAGHGCGLWRGGGGVFVACVGHAEALIALRWKRCR